MKFSFITTVFNEEDRIGDLLKSLLIQTVTPDEVIVVDGGSTDDTLGEIKKYKAKFDKKHILFEFFTKKGNRSVGRNAAIKKARGDIVLCSDAGCLLDKNWIKNITKSFEDKGVDVVAGYYEGIPENIFQKCLIPYFLVMPDELRPSTFLPATRSMGFRKDVWKNEEGFDEKLSHNEDYDFAKRIERNKYKIIFAKDAIVYWFPPMTIKKAFVTFMRFAYGDVEAGIYRPKAVFTVLRYILGLILLMFLFYTKSLFLTILIPILIINYLLWAILKNYFYVKDFRAIVLLPFIQLLSDFAVILGTFLGFLRRIGK